MLRAAAVRPQAAPPAHPRLAVVPRVADRPESRHRRPPVVGEPRPAPGPPRAPRPGV